MLSAEDTTMNKQPNFFPLEAYVLVQRYRQQTVK